jgi:hypothetical protein
MNSPQDEQEHWEKLIRSVRGSRAARVWYLYKTGGLEKAMRDQGHFAKTDKSGPANLAQHRPDRPAGGFDRGPGVGEGGTAGTGCTGWAG